MSRQSSYPDDTDPYQPPRIAYVPDRVSKTPPVVERPEEAATVPELPAIQEGRSEPVRSPLLFSVGVLLIALSLLILASSAGFFYFASKNLSEANSLATVTAQNVQKFALNLEATATAAAQNTPTANTPTTVPTSALSPTPATTPDVKAT